MNKRERMWIPEVEPMIEKQEIVLAIAAGSFAGFVKIELIEAVTGIVKECYEFPNIILTAGLDGLIAGRTLMNNMLSVLTIGTGSTSVSPSDLHLDELVASTSFDGGISDVFDFVAGDGGGPFGLGNPYHNVIKTRVFLEDEANFPTISELGWRSLATPNIQFTRALIKDVTGSPITIAKTSDDQLRISYEIRGYPPTVQTSGSFVLADSETSHSFTASALEIAVSSLGRNWVFSLKAQAGPDPRGQFFDYGAWGGGITAYASASVPGNPTGTVSDWGWSSGPVSPDSESLVQPYISGTFARTKQAIWEPSAATFGSGGIQGMGITYAAFEEVMAFYFTPSIKKTDLQRLVFTYTAITTASVTSSV